ncbi:MAG: hypothetical protein IT296_06125, partial [Anaerolineae bacterium]|nr:hypothetical protein [Anaerolineae bacterium]
PLVAARTGRRFLAADETLRAVHTTRKRLTVTEAAFTLERDSAFPFDLQSSSFNLKLSTNSIILSNAADIDYWEMDPDWDGKTFRSAAQAARPARRGEIPSELEIKIGRRVCVRWVTVEGRQFQAELNV